MSNALTTHSVNFNNENLLFDLMFTKEINESLGSSIPLEYFVYQKGFEDDQDNSHNQYALVSPDQRNCQVQVAGRYFVGFHRVANGLLQETQGSHFEDT